MNCNFGPLQESNLQNSYLNLLKSGMLSDIELRVGQEIFKCHKLILAVASPVFEAMLFGNFKEKNQNEITITDIEPEDFKVFLEYIYTGRDIKNLEIYSIESLKGFIYIGDKYLCPAFAEFGYVGLEKAPLDVLRFVDLIELFDFAKNIDFGKLINAISEQFKKRTLNVNLFNSALVNLPLKTFNDLINCINDQAIRFYWIEEYVKQKKLNDPSVRALKLVEDTKNAITTEEEITKNECEPEKMETETITENWKILLESVNFDNMTIDEFMNGPAKSILFNSIDKFNILVKKCMAMEKKTCRNCGRNRY